MRTTTATLVLLMAVPAAAAAQTLVSGPDEPNQYVLPDPLTTAAGKRVSNKEEWPARRAEILELFRAHVYGRIPGIPTRVTSSVTRTDPGAMAGAATLKQISIRVEKDAATLTFPVVLFVPNARKAPAPVFLLINNRSPDNTDPTRAVKSGFWPAEEVIARGYAVAAFFVGDVAVDGNDGFKSGIHPLLGPAGPRAPDAWGKLSAWAWGASRVIDHLATDKDLDAAKIAVVGHSRGGKAALLTGAEDTRPAIMVSNDSGCTGAKISRRRTGEQLSKIVGNFPYWFAPRYRDYVNREDQLPIDQHELLGLSAPRAVYVASAEKDANADPRGEQLGLHHAGVVYGLWGHQPIPREAPALGKPVYSGPMGYHLRAGDHGLTPFDWQRFMDFADRIYGAAAPPTADAGGARTDAAPTTPPPQTDAPPPSTADGARPAPPTTATPSEGSTTPTTPTTTTSTPSPTRDAATTPAEPAPVTPRRSPAPRGCSVGPTGQAANVPVAILLSLIVAVLRRSTRRLRPDVSLPTRPLERRNGLAVLSEAQPRSMAMHEQDATDIGPGTTALRVAPENLRRLVLQHYTAATNASAYVFRSQR